ncbi:DUF3291 domain-containing protein [Pseudomonas sp. GX19020]|uniref:DUF3291 domain-containing protein n=1 Tax=Pseudomonas sp. GX19020 TaxID=2942277 RepID=UPI002019C5E2|nr:DUF3291 domain-containing protein [Pseudomonas sp. GX19020]MCL4066939.1 DUF3291 domain-containing protein [Pseudomonas sp. GX19020]
MTARMAHGKALHTRDGCHLAALNFGLLRHDWDAPEVVDFVAGLDLVNGVAERAAGFVWRLDDAAMDAAQADPASPSEGSPRMADMAEGYARWQHRNEFGDSDQAFGWSYLEEAATWTAHACDRIAAE